MPLSASPWWWTAEIKPGPSSTWPSQIFSAPTVFWAIAASRSIAPLAWSGQRSLALITRKEPVVGEVVTAVQASTTAGCPSAGSFVSTHFAALSGRHGRRPAAHLGRGAARVSFFRRARLCAQRLEENRTLERRERVAPLPERIGQTELEAGTRGQAKRLIAQLRGRDVAIHGRKRRRIRRVGAQAGNDRAGRIELRPRERRGGPGEDGGAALLIEHRGECRRQPTA